MLIYARRYTYYAGNYAGTICQCLTMFSAIISSSLTLYSVCIHLLSWPLLAPCMHWSLAVLSLLSMLWYGCLFSLYIHTCFLPYSELPFWLPRPSLVLVGSGPTRPRLGYAVDMEQCTCVSQSCIYFPSIPMMNDSCLIAGLCFRPVERGWLGGCTKKALRCPNWMV